MSDGPGARCGLLFCRDVDGAGEEGTLIKHAFNVTAAHDAPTIGLLSRPRSALVAGGNAALLERPDVTIRPVTGLSQATLALAWRRTDARAQVAALRAAVQAVISVTSGG